MLTPNVRGNAGCYRAFTVKAPEGSALNCDKPMAVNLRTRTGWYIAPNIFTALAKAAPGRVQAATGLPVAINIYGRDAAGQIYSDHLFMGGGQGGSEAGDGVSALLWPTSAANTSIELFEQRVPVLVTEKAYVPDSGGPGRHRGGLGQRVSVRKLDGDGLPTLCLGLSGRRRHRGAGPVRRQARPLRAWRRARRHRRDHPGLRHRPARLHHDRSGDRRGVPLGRLRLRLAVRAAARGDRARPRRRLRHGRRPPCATTAWSIGADGKLDMAESARRREPGTAAE